MLSHISLGVQNLDGAAEFNDAVLSALGFVRLWTGPDGLGYGAPGGGETCEGRASFRGAATDWEAEGPGAEIAIRAATAQESNASVLIDLH